MMQSDLEPAVAEKVESPESHTPNRHDDWEVFADEQRLHPLSWLFALVAFLGNFIVPILAFLFLGQGNDTWELWGLLGGVGLALHAWLVSRRFRYRLTEDELIIRSGIFSRTERHIPFARIQNIVQQRNILHRLFGVTDLKLESAAGGKAEASMKVITDQAAQRLETILRGLIRSTKSEPDQQGIAADTDSSITALLNVPLSDLVRYGIISNRGMVVVGGASAFLYQFGPSTRSFSPGTIFRAAKSTFAPFTEAIFGFASNVVSIALLVIAALIVLRIFSILLAIFTYYGFRLEQDGERITAEAGLLTRIKGSVKPEKIQKLQISEGVLHRWFKRQALSVTVATGKNNDKNSPKMKWLAPIAQPDQVENIITTLWPNFQPAEFTWQPLHPRAWVRLFKAKTIWIVVFALGAAMFTPLALLALALVPLNYLYARGYAKFTAYTTYNGLLVFRCGWLMRKWVVMPIEKIQVVNLTQTPFDRRNFMHRLVVDTAGGGVTAAALTIPYLGTEVAQQFFDELKIGVEQLSAR